MKGFRHLRGLYSDNAEIQQLSAEIATQERHRKYLQSLYYELVELGRRKAELSQQWENEYAPAEQLRYELEIESTFAKTRPSDYFDYLLDQLVHLPVETINRMVASAAESRKHIKPPPALRTGSENSSQSFASLSTLSKMSFGTVHALSIAPSLTSAATSISETPQVKRHRTIWPKVAKSRLEELRIVHAQNDMDMRSVASQTCALTVQVKALKRELGNLEEKMQQSPEAIYHNLKLETDEHRLRIMKQVHHFIQGRQIQTEG